MGKIKGGLGDASLISDLTKPITFHISESLEPPPVYERRKKIPAPDVEKKEDELAGIILKKAASVLDERGNIKVIFYVEGRSEALLLETVDNGKCRPPSVILPARRKGEFDTIPWQDSSFSAMDMKDILDDLSPSIKRIELISEAIFLNFSSLHDFYEWLEI
ncbi:MAG: hypothetical protein OEV42_00890 [Deltaproteobacteria bacterium]|nr:hypothetical protein [Deltaproteobacteria bacterium]